MNMKTRTKQCGVFVALAAVLLLSAALIAIGCVEALGPGGLTVPQEKERPTFVPPPGKGYVMLNFGGSSGRTIRPASTAFVANAAAFAHFDVIFTPDSAGGTPGTLDNTNGLNLAYNVLINKAFLLGDGDYIVQVWAHSGTHAANDNDVALAYGVAALTVDDNVGDPAPVTINLREISDATHGGTGTLDLKLTNSSFVANSYVAPATAVKITVIKWPGNEGTSVTDIDLLAVTPSAVNILNTYTANLPPGFYQVALTLSGANARWGDKTLSEILHIYQGMTSIYTDTLPAVSRNVYDFSFNYGDGRTGTGGGATGVAIQSVNHGTAVTEPSGTVTDHFSDPTQSLAGWYTVNNSWITANEYDFDTKVLRDKEIFAHWTTTGIYVGVNFVKPTENAPVLSIALSGGGSFGGLTSLTNPPTIVITFSNTPVGEPATAPYSGISWEYDGVTISGETGNSLTLNLATDAYIDLLQEGPHRITVKTTHSSAPESSYIDFSVTTTP
jgi:hypothetical protein